MDFFEIDEDTDLNLLHFKFKDLNNQLGYVGAKEVVSSWEMIFMIAIKS